MSEHQNGLGVMKGTLSPEGGNKSARAKTAPRGRKCLVCPTGLSIYNPGDTCYQHSKPQHIGGGPRR